MKRLTCGWAVSTKRKGAVADIAGNLAWATLNPAVAPADAAAGSVGVKRVRRMICTAAPDVPSIQSSWRTSAAATVTTDVEEEYHSKLATMSAAAETGGNPDTVAATAVPAALAAADDGAVRVTAGLGGALKMKSAGKSSSSCLSKDKFAAPM